MKSRVDFSHTLSFEQVSEKHIPILFAWLNSSRLKGIYDNGFSSHEQLRKKYLLADSTIKRYIVCHQGSLLGYIQAYEVLPGHECEKYRKEVGSTVGIDLFIGEDSFLHKGYGFSMLKEFIPFLGKNISRILVDPLIGNPSIKLFKKYGLIEIGQEGYHQILSIDIRYTARGLILNDKRELLLMRIEDNTTYDALRKDDHFWVTIGGTIEEGETEEEAVSREIIEETGINDFSVGELAFFGQHTLLFSGFPVRHFEKYYLVHANQFDTHQENLTHNEKQIFRELYWWPLADLLSTKEVVYPRCLGAQMQGLMQGEKIPKEIEL